jgi:hypothetical protein
MKARMSAFAPQPPGDEIGQIVCAWVKGEGEGEEMMPETTDGKLGLGGL